MQCKRLKKPKSTLYYLGFQLDKEILFFPVCSCIKKRTRNFENYISPVELEYFNSRFVHPLLTPSKYITFDLQLEGKMQIVNP